VKPQWKEGQFIMPQHFQALDAYHEEQLDSRISAMAEYGWGVAKLEVDAGELARGLFVANECTAVLNDGLIVEVDEERPLQVTVQTKVGLVGGGQEAEVYLAVPGADRRGTSSYAGDGSAAGTRFVHSVHKLEDEYGAATAAEVDLLQPNAQLILGHESLQSYVHIKLAELVVSETGSLNLSSTYIPPCVRIRASVVIMDRLGQLVSSLGAKQKHLADRYGGRAGNLIEFGSADMTTFWYMHTLNTWLPLLLHYSREGHAHPEQLYLTLCSLSGQLSSFEVGKRPEDLPKFNFLDLRSTFIPLFDTLMALLGKASKERYSTISLEHRQPGLFVADIRDPQALRARGGLYLVVGGDVSQEALKVQVPRYLKVGSLQDIPTIVQSSLPGVPAKEDLSPPPAIPIRSHMVYLKLDRHGEYWDRVLQSQTLAIYQCISPDQVSLELIAVEG